MPHKFIIAASPRTGSRMLSSALARHSKLSVAGEVYNPLVTTRHIKRKLVNCNTVLAVFKVYDGYVLHDHQGGMYKVYMHLPTDLRIIWLSRQNEKERIASLLIADRTQCWHHRMRSVPYVSFYLEPPLFKKAYQRGLQAQQEARRQLGNRESIEVTYEQLVSDWNTTLKRICQFVGVPFELVRPRSKKQVRNHSAIISNYKELTV